MTDDEKKDLFNSTERGTLPGQTPVDNRHPVEKYSPRDDKPALYSLYDGDRHIDTYTDATEVWEALKTQDGSQLTVYAGLMPGEDDQPLATRKKIDVEHRSASGYYNGQAHPEIEYEFADDFRRDLVAEGRNPLDPDIALTADEQTLARALKQPPAAEQQPALAAEPEEAETPAQTVGEGIDSPHAFSSLPPEVEKVIEDFRTDLNTETIKLQPYMNTLELAEYREKIVQDVRNLIQGALDDVRDGGDLDYVMEATRTGPSSVPTGPAGIARACVANCLGEVRQDEPFTTGYTATELDDIATRVVFENDLIERAQHEIGQGTAPSVETAPWHEAIREQAAKLQPQKDQPVVVQQAQARESAPPQAASLDRIIVPNPTGLQAMFASQPQAAARQTIAPTGVRAMFALPQVAAKQAGNALIGTMLAVANAPESGPTNAPDVPAATPSPVVELEAPQRRYGMSW